MKNILLLIIITGLSVTAGAQSTDNTELRDKAKNGIHLSYGGSGIYFSTMYERHIITKEAWNAGLKAGIGSSFSSVLFPYEFSIPAGAFFLYGKGNHHLDLSANITAYLMDQYDYPKDRSYKEVRFLLAPSLAYRYQKPAGGFIGRFGVSPVFNFNKVKNSFAPWVDLSIGWGF